ncbi:MAG: hypothetical protein ACERKN_12355 [Velocimicrobium sp.]
MNHNYTVTIVLKPAATLLAFYSLKHFVMYFIDDTGGFIDNLVSIPKNSNGIRIKYTMLGIAGISLTYGRANFFLAYHYGMLFFVIAFMMD